MPKIVNRPYSLDLQFRGFIEGLAHVDSQSSDKPLCYYFGGIPYALPPVGPFRFQKPRPLPPCYRYGTRANPGRYVGGSGLCPQPNKDGKLNADEWDEDCLQLNVWMPAGDTPDEGWPVLFYIHGGFLQVGSPNSINPIALLSETSLNSIIVIPGYRLNIFGFLSAAELLPSQDFTPNAGFWDQRLALEWTWQNASYFGGNASNITIQGYSAGAHSVFHQLRYDLSVPDSKGIIKRAMMLSNGPGVQPKSVAESQEQFEQLLSALQIPSSLSPADKLARLRSLPAKSLLEAARKIPLHQFRGVTDDSFIASHIVSELDSGLFAARLKRRNISLVIGECEAEYHMYGVYIPPSSMTIAALSARLKADYPSAAVDALMRHYFPNGRFPKDRFKNWSDAFGRIYADLQVYALERGMVSALVKHGAGHLVHRYRIEWRAGCCDAWVRPKWGVTHTTDMAIWFWGNGFGLSEGEKDVLRRAFIEPLASFVRGTSMDWKAKGLQLRTLKQDGSVVVEEDSRLEDGLRVWEVLGQVDGRGRVRESKL
ncbi:paraben-hydrolyzing esterase precursor [Corynespora cassiicola Philippines]|uniref:Carboxylic ester hydrolase n=1 Tax=Corynespora cassiicola Philippines TaxID=1448308 RepID=A0A2T2P734_CORCC|nr:paraben-hydrolyzing esterase precursor [Corynespora cassiicola Philippines]